MARRPVRRGAAALEFALVLPVLLALTVGIIDFGWYFQANGRVVAAVREGTRLGVTYATDDSPTPEDAAEARIAAVLTEYNFDAASADVVTEYIGTAPDEMLKVTVTLPFDPLIGLVRVVLPVELKASMTMLLEQQDS
ncbi:MAG: TadE/TadG family type IV pilus assembly protein [Myxococcota bacterium]